MNGINIPADTLITGLRQRRSELSDQLDRLESTKAAVECDIEAIDRVMQIITGRRVPEPQERVPAQAPVRNRTGRVPRGDLTGAVLRALRTYGPLTTADITEAAREWLPTAKLGAVGACASRLKMNGVLDAVPSETGSREYLWRLTEAVEAA